MDKTNVNSKTAVNSNTDRRIPTVVAVSSEPNKEDKEEDKSVKDIMRGIFNKITKLIMDFLESITVAASIFVVVYLFLVQPHEVKGSSMQPNFFDKEYILTDKISYKFSDPQRGDVIIFKSPVNEAQDYIKRIIGMPGDKVKIEDGNILINGEILYEPYLNDKTLLGPGSYMQEGVEIVVPFEYYFALGDNRPHSSDSREFGPIPKKNIRGRARLIYWPIKKLGVIENINY